MAGQTANIKAFFDNTLERVTNKAEENLKKTLPWLSGFLHDYAVEEMKKNKMRSMTGNFINSFGVALYRDGKFVAMATTNQEEGSEPIQVTLASGDTFLAGSMRYEGRKQYHTFTAPDGTRRILANEEVVRWLKHRRPTKTKGLSMCAVSVVDYSRSVGGDRVLLRLAEDVENMGGDVKTFNLG